MALLQDNLSSAVFRNDVDCGIFEPLSDQSRSAHIASCFLELEKLNQELKSKLRDDFTNILNGMGSISLSSTPQPPSPSPTPPSRSSRPIHDTSFIIEAHSWLLDNIANPYPSSSLKASLSRRHSCALSSVSSWFINTRRRIGWTALCRDYFNNCRADALDAAYRAFIKEDPNRQLPPDVVHAFVSVQVAAEELYSSTLAKSALANDLDMTVKDVSKQETVLVHEQECLTAERTGKPSKVLDVSMRNQPLVTRNCYPSPDSSPPSFPIPVLNESFTDESEDNDDIPPPTLSGRKRRLSFSECRTSAFEPTTRFVKRPRYSSSVNAYLPSPTTSADEFSENDQMMSFVSISQGFSPKARKRRLSDEDTIGTPKGPQDSKAQVRFHTVSDPFPPSRTESEQSIDEWFKANFDALFVLPPPADVGEPDLSTQWEVELFNNYILPRNPQETLTSSTQDYRISSSNDLSALDDLLQSLESDRFAAPPEMMDPPITGTASSPVSHGASLLPDLSQSVDWTALLSGTESTSHLVFPQSCFTSALSEIDLSILQLPQAWTTAVS